jgi:hypothetical protein
VDPHLFQCKSGSSIIYTGFDLKNLTFLKRELRQVNITDGIFLIFYLQGTWGREDHRDSDVQIDRQGTVTMFYGSCLTRRVGALPANPPSQWGKKSFFLSTIAGFYSLGLHEDPQATGDAFGPQRGTSSTSKHDLSTFWWAIFALPKQCGSGSTTLD